MEITLSFDDKDQIGSRKQKAPNQPTSTRFMRRNFMPAWPCSVKGVTVKLFQALTGIDCAVHFLYLQDQISSSSNEKALTRT